MWQEKVYGGTYFLGTDGAFSGKEARRRSGLRRYGAPLGEKVLPCTVFGPVRATGKTLRRARRAS